jgi:N-acetylmuramoyl-L-alanine amidase
MNIVSKPSPNFFKGRKTYKPIAIVVHIMEGTLDGTDSWFGSTASKVSAHYGIGKTGLIHQYVQESDSAWHAGRVNAPSWKLIKAAGTGTYINPNYYTIGIEHEGNDDSDWTDDMYASSSSLIKAISNRWHIPLDRDHIIGHHEIYSLKTCPGDKVDLSKLISLASGNTPAPTPLPPERILQLGSVTSNARLNIRRSPNRNIAPVATVSAGTILAYDGFTETGESISGNAKWFYTSEGTWFWSGGVN